MLMIDLLILFTPKVDVNLVLGCCLTLKTRTATSFDAIAAGKCKAVVPGREVTELFVTVVMFFQSFASYNLPCIMEDSVFFITRSD